MAHRHGARVHTHPHRGQHRHLHLALLRSQPVSGTSGPRHHGHGREHAHPRDGHDPDGHAEHGHSHGLIDDSIKRSREGLRAVLASFGVLGAAAAIQVVVFVMSASVALLADLIHNFGDALTAVPLGIAFLARSKRAERRAGLVVVAVIFASACIAAIEAVQRLLEARPPGHLLALAIAGGVGYFANALAARIRIRAGHRLHSSALVADGHHARADALVSLGVIASAGVVSAGVPAADPVIGLVMTVVIFRITLQSWRIVREDE